MKVTTYCLLFFYLPISNDITNRYAAGHQYA